MDCSCIDGWVPGSSGVERCDECRIFDGDLEACKHVERVLVTLAINADAEVKVKFGAIADFLKHGQWRGQKNPYTSARWINPTDPDDSDLDGIYCQILRQLFHAFHGNDPGPWESTGVICDRCGDHSNSTPNLQCGRVDDNEEPDGAPCRGTYR